MTTPQLENEDKDAPVVEPSSETPHGHADGQDFNEVRASAASEGRGTDTKDQDFDHGVVAVVSKDLLASGQDDSNSEVPSKETAVNALSLQEQEKSQVDDSRGNTAEATITEDSAEQSEIVNAASALSASVVNSSVEATKIAANLGDSIGTEGYSEKEEKDRQQSSHAEQERLRMVEEMHIGTASEILFPPTPVAAAELSVAGGDWDNLRWMSLSGSRKVVFSRVVFRRTKEQTTIIMWKSNIRISFPARLLVLYEHPRVLLLLRRAKDLDELSTFTLVDYTTDKNWHQAEESPENILQHYWIVENVVDLTTCKLQLSPLTTHNISEVVSKVQHERELSCFQIVTPLDTNICLSAVQVRSPTKSKQEVSFTDSGAFMETSSTENALIQAICQAHADANSTESSATMYSAAQQPDDDTWKHQVILGTLHAYVLSGHKNALEQALERAWKNLNFKGNYEEGNDITQSAAVQRRILPERIIDATDDNKHPPIYYACKESMNDAISLLVRYGASLDYTTSPLKDSLLHICARNRNHEGIDLLLSVEAGRPTIHPNALNTFCRTPLYTALVDGRKADSKSLEACIEVLKAHDGTIFVSGLCLPHPLLVLTMEYRNQDMAVLLPFLRFDFPLTGNTDLAPRYVSVSSRSGCGDSLAALYGYPLHLLFATIYGQIMELSSGLTSPLIHSNKNSAKSTLSTLRLLLQCGFEANERLEGGAFVVESLKSFVGFAPIQILAAAALELEKVGPNLGQASYGDLDAILSQLCEELIQTGGARLSLEPPPLQRKRTQSIKSSSPQKQRIVSTTSETSLEESDKKAESANIDRSLLKIDANDHLVQLLGGLERLKLAQATYGRMGAVMLEQTRAPRLLDESTSNIEDSDAPGGSSDKSCAICWKAFGALINRKHRCRLSWKHVCDDCSTKRILVKGKDYRVTDGQFVRTRVLMEAKAATAPSRQPRKGGFGDASRTSLSSSSEKGSATAASRARLQRLESEEKANRDSLFGGDVMEQAKNLLFGGATEGPDKPAERMDGLMNSLGETRNALLERGDKLSSLNDKSAQMVSASEDFAKLANELRKKSERGLFW
ncbi:hypothetical protein ACA910_021042 [Epithemia clementina (nom. ined.)]